MTLSVRSTYCLSVVKSARPLITPCVRRLPGAPGDPGDPWGVRDRTKGLGSLRCLLSQCPHDTPYSYPLPQVFVFHPTPTYASGRHYLRLQKELEPSIEIRTVSEEEVETVNNKSKDSQWKESRRYERKADDRLQMVRGGSWRRWTDYCVKF